MAIIELSTVTGIILKMGVERALDKAKRREAVIATLEKVSLKPGSPPPDFDAVYVYTLVEYGIGKPQPILDFFRHDFIRGAFRESFEKRDPAILNNEAESLIEWHKVGDDLRRLDVDPRREFARFTAVFNEIVDRTRTPADVRRDQKLDDIYGDLHLKADDILGRLDKLTELDGIRQEISRLTESYQAREFVMVPTGDRLKVFISSKMGELRDVRETVTQALQARGIDAWVYEARASARPDDVVRASLSEVEAADIYVGLFRKEYGEVTAKEYRHARALRKPCFVYIRDKDLTRDGALEEFLRTDVYDLSAGVGYSYFDSASKLGSQVGDDIMAWLVRQHREMSAAIQAAQVSKTEIERLQAEVDRLQAVSRKPLPDGTPVDYLALQMRAWFETLGYRFESYSVHAESHFEWIIDVPTRRGHDRILVRGVEGEADLGGVQALRQVVDTQHCDEGWLVAPRRVSQLARQEVCDKANRDLFCYTFDELLDEAADFTGYLKWLEGEIKRRGIDSGYIPLACTKEELDPRTGAKIGESRYDQQNGWIDGYVDRWLDDPSKEHISVLGEFGTGKTWFALHYAWVSLVRYREAKEHGTERPRLPLVIPLRDYAKRVSVESLFSEFFFRKHEIPLPSYSAFEQLNRMGKLLLIFDGFDEMAAKVDRQQMINNFWELASVVTPGAKVILTCRTEHFPTAQQGRALLRAELQASTAKLTGEPPQFEVLELAKFDEDQIRQALLLRTTSAVAERIMENKQLLDLASRPLMVELILEALPDIEAGKPIDLARVYLYAVRQKMERDIRAERTFTSLADKLYFLCEVSWEMLSTDRMSLNYRLFPERLRRFFGPVVEQQVDLDHWHYDMMSQTMLVRNTDGDYMPSHRSLVEFFVAYKLAAELGVLAPDFTELAQAKSYLKPNISPTEYTWSDYFQPKSDDDGKPTSAYPMRGFATEKTDVLVQTLGRLPLPSAVLDLLLPMVTEDSETARDRLLAIILSTHGRNPKLIGYVGGNAATILAHIQPNALRDRRLEGANLNRANLSEADLTACDLRGASLQSVDFGGALLMDADLRDTDLSDTRFGDSLGAFFGYGVSFYPNTTILALPQRHSARLVDAFSGKSQRLLWSRNTSGFVGVAWMGHPHKLVAVCWNGEICVWEPSEWMSRSVGFYERYRPQTLHTNRVNDLIALTYPDGREVDVFSVEQWQQVGSIQAPQLDWPDPSSVVFSADGSTLFCAHAHRGRISVWRPNSEVGTIDLERLIPDIFRGHAAPLYSLGKDVLAIESEHMITVVNLGTQVVERVFVSEEPLTGLAVSQSTGLISAIAGKNEIAFWLLQDPNVSLRFPMPTGFRYHDWDLHFSDDGSVLVAVGIGPGRSREEVGWILDTRMFVKSSIDLENSSPWPEWWEKSHLSVPNGALPNPDFGKPLWIIGRMLDFYGLRLSGARPLDVSVPVGGNSLGEWLARRGAILG